MTDPRPVDCYTIAVAILLALASACAYGVSDYGGGRLSRRVSPMAIAFVADAGLLAVLFLVVPVVEGGAPSSATIAWSVLAGVCGGLGTLGLYEALSRGNMTVVAPVTGVVAAIVPVVTGVVLGERPGVVAVIGIVGAIIAVGLVGGAAGATRVPFDLPTLLLAIAVGFAFGLMLVGYSRAGDDAGLWPLLAARCASAPLLGIAFVVARRRGAAEVPPRSIVAAACLVGLTAGLANGLYLFATRRGLLAVVASVGSLYPASTVALASLLDRERSTRAQIVGMAIAAISVVLITIGS